ncbi:hypothetical protein [Anaerotignum sp.]|nr:hypothetical protein [Anaerotignum sp.]MBQ7757970.1 hypothetical protein [Anaerotignum sp.]
MFDFQTTAFLLDATEQTLETALEGGAALTLIPVAAGTIVGICVVGLFAKQVMKKGDYDRRHDPNKFKRLK